MMNIIGKQNKNNGKHQIAIEKINFKVFDYYLLQGIEVKYIFDDKQQQIIANQIPFEVDLIEVKKLVEMNIMRDIDSFFKIIQIIAQS